MTAKFKVLLLNGPNLNMLGKREPEIYGAQTLTDIVDELSARAENLSIELLHVQSNSEQQLIETIHQAFQKID